MATNLQTATRFASVNPATGELLRDFEPAGAHDVEAAIARARAAQPAWSAIGVGKRIAIFRQFQQRLHEKKNDVARLITQEAGKPQVEALLTEVQIVLDAARFCIDSAHSFLRDEPLPHANLVMKTKSGYIRREPYGVIAIISPWNYPFSIPATESMAALVMGNCVVLKPSELTSLVALELASLLHDSGVPRDVFQTVLGDGSTGAALIRGPIDKCVFTGSVAIGKRIAQECSSRLVPAVLELGGKDPMIVLDDANLDVAASGAVWGAFVNAGQACLSVERCYVHRKLHDLFVEECAKRTKQLRVGNGLDPGTDVGPMIHERQLRIVESHVKDAIALGARVVVGGQRMPDLGANFYAPTVLTGVTHDMRIMREETFGPVLPIMAFDSDEEAIRLANDSEYGLAASVWTSDQSRGKSIAARLQAGTVMVNDVVSCFGIAEAPHGGVKASGTGRAHGRFGFEEMTRIKYVNCDRLPGMKKVWWYGYGEAFGRQMEGFLDLQFASNWASKLRGGIRAAGAVIKSQKR